MYMSRHLHVYAKIHSTILICMTYTSLLTYVHVYTYTWRMSHVCEDVDVFMYMYRQKYLMYVKTYTSSCIHTWRMSSCIYQDAFMYISRYIARYPYMSSHSSFFWRMSWCICKDIFQKNVYVKTSSCICKDILHSSEVKTFMYM